MTRLRAASLAVCVAALVHGASLGGGFVHDDAQQIAGNPLVAGLAELPLLWTTGVWAGAGSGSSFYRPVMMTSFALDAALLGRAPLPMHAVQLALFAALVLIGLALVSRLEAGAGAGRGVAVGLGAALVLAVHPVNVEPVAWLSARCEILAALFGMLALTARHSRLVSLTARYSRPAGSSVAAQASNAPRLGPAALAGAEGIALFLALAAKESAASFVPVLLALDRSHGATSGWGAGLRRWAPAAAASGLYLALRSNALGSVSGGLVGAADPALLAGAFGQGLVRLVWPLGLTITPVAPGLAEMLLGAVAAAIGGALLVLGFVRRASWLLPVTLGLAGLATAASGAARIGELADRYLLLPSLAAGWLAARGIALAPVGVSRAARLASVCVLGVLAVLSVRHVPVYATNERLWRNAVERNPASERAVINLSSALLDAGEVSEAMPWLERAGRLAPDDVRVRLNRAVAMAASGDSAVARQMLQELVAGAPGFWQAQLRLGHLALDAGDLDEAARHYEGVLAANGLAAEAWAGLGVARARQGRDDEARAAIGRALGLDPQLENADALRRLLASLPGGGS